MKIDECKIGMTVRGKNCFGLTYTITEVMKSRVKVEHRTGEKKMKGGKMVDEVFTYTMRPSIFRPV